MQNSPINRVVVIKNKQGLHARPAGEFVKLARTFESKVEVVRDGRRVPGNSMIDLLTLGAAEGTQLIIEAEGSDAQQAIEALAELVENVFPQEDNEQVEPQGED